jgi:hypothetical protein
MTVPEIARHAGVSPETIEHLVFNNWEGDELVDNNRERAARMKREREAGLTPWGIDRVKRAYKRSRGRQPKLNKGQVAWVKSIKDKWHVDDIAKALHVSRPTVYACLKDGYFPTDNQED